MVLNHRRFYSLLLTVIIFFNQGCGKPLVLTNLNSQHLFQASAVGLAQPNRYSVHLKWEQALVKNAEDKNWVIQKTLKNNAEKKSLESFILSNLETTDNDVEPGETYQYEMGTLRSNQFHARAKAAITIPRDLVVSKLMHVSSLVNYGRIYLTSEGIIRTEGDNFELTAQELHSNGGVIESFNLDEETIPGPLDAPIAAELNERKVPKLIVIKAGVASGTLKIIARGKRGSTSRNQDIGGTGEDSPRVYFAIQKTKSNITSSPFDEIILAENTPKPKIEVSSRDRSFLLVLERFGGSGGTNESLSKKTKGIDGKVSPACIKIENIIEGECDSFLKEF